MDVATCSGYSIRFVVGHALDLNPAHAVRGPGHGAITGRQWFA